MSDRDAGIVSIVDDDPSLRRSVRNLLTSVGLQVQAFASAEEFLESSICAWPA
jgi:FixJ family two-component response regulator